MKGAIGLGLLWAIMAIGIYMTYRILDISDLTSEGSFTLGAATLAFCTINEMNPYIAIGASMVAGALAGLVTGLMHTKLKIPTLLAGILSMTGIYSINLRIMGQANISLTNQDTLLARWANLLDFAKQRDAALVIGVVILRATGNNEQMIRASGVNTDFMKVVGLMIGNALIAMSGGLVAQYNGYADVGMGIGAIVIGLASVIIGEVFFGRKHLLLSLIGVGVGSIIYRIIVALVLDAGLPANDMRLFTAILVAIAISLPQIKASFTARLRRKHQC